MSAEYRMPVICGQRPKRGTTRKVNIKLSETVFHQPARVPVTIIAGREPGPTLFLTAAVHGDEINGVAIVRRVLERVNADDLRGVLVVVPVVNRFGFPHGDRYMPDRRDLNRSFPGNPDGSMASRMAHALFEKVIRSCDYGIDLHTAASGRSNLCHVRGDSEDEQVRAIMKAFGVPIMLDGAGPKGSLRGAATAAGVPTIIFEAGEPNRFEEHVVEMGTRGVLRVLRHVGMLPGRLRKPPLQTLIKQSEWVRSNHGGIVHILVEPGDLVGRGKRLATIEDPYGRHVDHIRAPFSGVVLSTSTIPLCNPGTAMVHLARLRKTLKAVRTFVEDGGDLGHIHVQKPRTVKKRSKARATPAASAPKDDAGGSAPS